MHDSTTAVSDMRDDPMVCKFYLDAFNFDTVQSVSWTIHQQPPTGTAQVKSGSLMLSGGAGHTPTMSLPDGHYKVEWTFAGEHGSAKHKVFKVACPSPSPSPSGSPNPSGSPSPSGGGGGHHGGGHGHGRGPGGMPAGGVAAGGGGSVQSGAGVETAAGAGAALLAAGAAAGAWRLRRRRSA